MGKLSYFNSFVIYFVSNNKITSGKCLNLVLLSDLRKTFIGYFVYNNIRTGANFVLHCLLNSMNRDYKWRPVSGNVLSPGTVLMILFMLMRKISRTLIRSEGKQK